MKTDTQHPTLILIRGLPGSGKTHLAHELKKALGAENVLMLDPDTIDLTSQAFRDFSKLKTQEGIDEKFHPYRWSREQAYKAIEANQVIMWNQPFTNLDGFTKTITNLDAYATEHGKKLPLLVVEVEIDPSLAKQRVDQRKREGGHGPSDNTFDRFTNEYVSFAQHGWRTVIVKGDDDVEKSAATVLNALKNL